MSGPLEHLLDFTLNTREQRRHRHKADLGVREQTAQASYKELQRRRNRFSTETRSFIRKAAAQANRHLATRPERCEFCELPEFSTGPWYPGKPNCAPIAYELRVNGRDVGETLVVQLTSEGMIAARLWPLSLTDNQDHVARIDLGWSAIPLHSFDAKKAEDLLVLYLTVLTQRWQIDGENADRVTAQIVPDPQ